MMVPGHTTVGLQVKTNETSGIEYFPEGSFTGAGIDCISLQGYNYYYKKMENTETIPPVVFISGAFQCMASWTKFVEFFKKYTTVITVDLPGTGMSDALPRAYSLDFLATALPNSVYTTIKDADHLFHIERFGVKLDLLDRFFLDKPFEDTPGCSAFTFRSTQID